MIEFKGLENFKIPTEIIHSQAPYIHCNEEQQNEVLKNIASLLASSEQAFNVHIGFSVWFNLDLLSVTNSQYAIILDIDPKISVIYKKLQFCLEKADTPAKFIDLFYKELLKDERFMQFPQDFQLEMLNKELTKGYGFLSSQESFSRIKELSSQGRIFFGQADMTNEKQMAQIADWCKKNNAIYTLYLSNIPEWILENGSEKTKVALKKNLQLLIKKNTVVIDAFYLSNEKISSGPPQRITVGDIPNFSKKSKAENKKKRTYARRATAKRSLNPTDDDSKPFKLPPMNSLAFLSMPAALDKVTMENKSDSESFELSQSDKENISPNFLSFDFESSLSMPAKKNIDVTSKNLPLLSETQDDLSEAYSDFSKPHGNLSSSFDFRIFGQRVEITDSLKEKSSSEETNQDAPVLESPTY